MLTTQDIKKAFNKLALSEKISVRELAKEYKNAIAEIDKNYDEDEIRRYWASERTVLHSQICTLLNIPHRESGSSTIVEALCQI